MNKTSASTRTASSVTEEDIEVAFNNGLIDASWRSKALAVLAGTLDDWGILEMLADQINFAAR